MVRGAFKTLKDPTRMPLPVPPEALRVGPLRAGAFTWRLHSERVAALLGTWLGITFTTCMVTGLYSHFVQHPPAGVVFPSRPVALYHVTQGLQIALPGIGRYGARTDNSSVLPRDYGQGLVLALAGVAAVTSVLLIVRLFSRRPSAGRR